MPVTAVILCGGRSTRLGGQDKTAARLGVSTVLGQLVASLPAHWSIVCVGVPRPLPREVTWVREDPPFAGPLAAVAAGVALVSSPVTVLLAGDSPYAGALAVRLAAAQSHDAATAPHTRAPAVPHTRSPGAVPHPREVVAVATDASGHRNPLLSAHGTESLRSRLARADVVDAPARRVLDGVDLVGVPAGDDAVDIDTPADLRAARSRVVSHDRRSGADDASGDDPRAR